MKSLLGGGDFTLWSGLQGQWNTLVAWQYPNRDICMNDEMANRCNERPKVKRFALPQDISITGFDDFNVSRLLWSPFNHRGTTSWKNLWAFKLILLFHYRWTANEPNRIRVPIDLLFVKARPPSSIDGDITANWLLQQKKLFFCLLIKN